MGRTDSFRLFADYNLWMNDKIYTTAAMLPAAALTLDRGAFFKSILGTLEHLVVADTLWLKRFVAHPSGGALAPIDSLPLPNALDQAQFGALEPLRERREMLDRLVIDWVGGLEENDFDVPLTYRRINGESKTQPFGLVLVHFFNHQTHHRGQTTTLLTQAGVDVGVTDLLVRVPTVEPL